MKRTYIPYSLDKFVQAGDGFSTSGLCSLYNLLETHLAADNHRVVLSSILVHLLQTNGVDLVKDVETWNIFPGPNQHVDKLIYRDLRR